MPEGVEAPSEGEVRAAHAEDMRASTRTTGIVGGGIILVAMPLWALYDRVVAPEVADRFLVLRILSLVPVLIAWLLLFRRPFGDRHAELLAAVGFASPQLVIAWMLPDVGQGVDGYLLGFSLVIYGSAFLLVARLRISMFLISVSWLATAASYTAQAGDVDRVEMTNTIFYLGTASVLAAVGRFLRMRLERAALAAHLALEAEQAHALKLCEELDRISREDSLTRVANRRAWDEALHRACAEAERTGSSLAVLLLDIDRFKQINDHYGHRRGDEVLQEVAGSLSRRIRDADLLARVGGDEFAVLCRNTGPEEARHLAGELTLLVAAMPGDLSVSVGSAVHWPGADPEGLMNLADRRLYDTKRARPVLEGVPVR